MSTYDDLFNRIEVKNAVRFIESVSGGYAYTKSGTARILPIILNPKPLQLQFDDNSYRFFRKDLVKRREEDMKECMLPAMDLILSTGYNCRLKSTEILDPLFDSNYNQKSVDGELFFGSEGQLLSKLANSSITSIKSHLPEKTNLEIKKVLKDKNFSNVANNPIRLAYFDRESLEEIIEEVKNGAISNLPFSALTFRIKTFESIALKMLERYRRIYYPTNKELREMSNGRETLLDKKELIEFYESWWAHTLALGEDIFDSMQSTQPSYYQKGYLAAEKGIETNLNLYGGKINERFSDTVPTDIVGGGIILKNDNAKQKLKGTIDHNLIGRITQLCHKREDNSICRDEDPKDGGITWGITSTRSAQFAELRAKSKLGFYRSEFGDGIISPHYKYRKSQLKALKEAIDKSEEMAQIATNCEKLFNLKLSKIGL